jgi:hypothetical protein
VFLADPLPIDRHDRYRWQFPRRIEAAAVGEQAFSQPHFDGTTRKAVSGVPRLRPCVHHVDHWLLAHVPRDVNEQPGISAAQPEKGAPKACCDHLFGRPLSGFLLEAGVFRDSRDDEIHRHVVTGEFVRHTSGIHAISSLAFSDYLILKEEGDKCMSGQLGPKKEIWGEIDSVLMAYV